MELPTLTDQQKKRYNTFRGEGMTPERAIVLATKNSESPYNPGLTKGVDKIFFGENSLASGTVDGVKEIFTGGQRTIAEDTERFGAEYAKDKAPLSYGAAFGRGLGEIIGAGLETADDLTGEVVSTQFAPVVEGAVNSDVGQYLLNKAVDFNESQGGAPKEILDLVSVGAISQVPKLATVKSLKDSFLKNSRNALNSAGEATANTGRLFDYLKPSARTTSPAASIDESLNGIKTVLETKLDQTAVLGSLDEIKEILRSNPDGLSDSIFAKIEDIDLTPEQRNTLQAEIGKIEELLKRDDAASVVEDYLNGTFDKVDSASGAAVGVIESLSDKVIDRGLQTINNFKEVPAKLSERAKGAVDRRIVRVTKNEPDVARQSILDLYKKAVVPGVKKKNKTVANIQSIDESIKRAIPELARKYDIEDLDDFATAIAAEKKAVFKNIEEGLVKAGNEGKAISMQPILDDLVVLSKSEIADFTPELRTAIDRMKTILADEIDGELVAKSISPSGAQDLIAQLNKALSPQYRGARTGADDTVDLVLVEKLRKLTDDVVEDLGEGSFKDLKSAYADLKAMEDDVVHRAIFEKQRGGRLSDLSDISSFADIAAGSLNPAFLTRGVAQFMSKEVINSLTDKNELVRQMFLYGKNLPDADSSVKPAIAPQTPDTDIPASSFGIDSSSEVFESLSKTDLSKKVDFDQGLKIEGDEINIFGAKAPLSAIEKSVLKDGDVKFETMHFLTKSGNRQANQPLAAYVVRGDGQKRIQFSPKDKNQATRQTVETFYHETGHAIDADRKLTTTRDTSVRAAIKKEGAALAMERAKRVMSPTIAKFDLDETQIKQLLSGQSVSISDTKRLAGKRQLWKYLTTYSEIFAEGYAMYRLNPAKFKEIAPTLYQEMSNIK